MSIAKMFAISFVLGGAVSSAFSSTMSRGISRLQQLNQQEAKLRNEQKKLTASHREATSELQQYQSKLTTLKTQHSSCCMTYAQYNTELRHITENINRASASSRKYASQLQEVQRQSEQISRRKVAMENFGNSKAGFSNAVSSFGKMASAVGMLTAPLAGVVKYSIDFDAAMSKVKAITGATAEDMKKLTDQAELLGRTTPYTATQSAEAMTYLGMAGWDTTQILAGMPSMLNLAVASGSDLAIVADILSDDLTAFGMSAEQAGHMADVFAAAATNSNTDVEKMGETFKYAGAIAGALGYKLEDVAIATGLMASASIKGEQAGTSLRAMMNRLVAPPASAAKAMEALGISVKNSDGSVKPFIETIKDLRTKFSGLSESEKAEKASAIAGTEALSGFLAIVNASDTDFNKLTNAINNADGTCGKMASTMQDNLKGDLTNVRSAMEAIAVAVGKAFTPSLREAAKYITTLVTETAKWVGEHQELVANIGKTTASIAGFMLGKKAFDVILKGAACAKDGMTDLWEESRTARGKILQFVKAAQGLTWGGVLGKIDSAFGAVRGALTGFIGILRGLSTGGLIKGGISVMQGLGGAIQGIGGALLAIGRAGIGAMFSPIGIAIMALAAAAYYCYTNWETVGPILAELWETIQTAFTNAWTMLQPAMQGLFDAFGTLSDVIGENSDIFATLAQILGGAVVGVFITVATVAVGALATAIEVIATLVSGAITTFTGLIQFITGVFTGDWDAAWQGVLKIFDGIFGTIGRIADRVFGGIQRTIKSISKSISSLSIGGGGSEIAHNAQGGIYNKGAFLTTFAEEGPEAAIPLDGSKRAVSLWQRAGEILGMFPENTPVGGFTRAPARQEMTPYMIPMETQQTPGYMDTVNPMTKTQPVAVTNDHNSPVDSSQTVNNNQRYESSSSTTNIIERFAPPPITINITVNGEAQVERIKEAVADAGQQMQRSFAEQMEEFMHNRGRLSFG